MGCDISVIVQTFERLPELQTCIHALRQYVEVPMQLIVADDGSATPDVLAFLESCGADAVFRNDDKQSHGPGYTLNQANKLATSPFVIHTEDDFHIQRPFTAEDLSACKEAFQTIPTMMLIRLRVLDGERTSAVRLAQYEEQSAQKYTFRNREFSLFRTYGDGGTHYQYTGNAHIRPRHAIETMGGYPEDVSIWSLENRLASRFRHNGYRCGSFRYGWFSHRHNGSTLSNPKTFKTRKRK